MSGEAVRTADLVKIIGSPFIKPEFTSVPDKKLVEIYNRAFHDRVAPLYLHNFRRKGWLPELEEYYTFVKNREVMTLTVLTDLAANLNDWNTDGYVIFKSIKPYPAIPNDTDVLIFGGKKEFESALGYLYKQGYIFHEWAPMQTTVYDLRGIGKVGAGKKGGTYYIDVYREISTDYVCYLSEKAIRPHVTVKDINGVDVRLLRPEPELAVILFHNVFPERTFQLEHFYMPLYYLAESAFDVELFVSFCEENRLIHAVKTNLSMIELLHNKHFGFVPEVITAILEQWGRNKREAARFIAAKLETPYLFSPITFWKCCLNKIGDPAFGESLFLQALHMINPLFFIDVMRSLKNRFSEEGVYHME